MPALGPNWMDPQYLLDTYGQAMFVISLVIVFVECGLLFPILPGDSLLFAIGLFIATGALQISFPFALVALAVAAFLGNVTGYEIGRAVGPALYRRGGRFLKPEYFEQTHAFFERYGNKALVLGRFVPIVRTFVTVVAGVGQMPRRRFFTWSAVGAVLWVTVVMVLGYYLGHIEIVRKNIEVAAILVVLVSVLPMLIEWLRHRRRRTHDTTTDTTTDLSTPPSAKTHL